MDQRWESPSAKVSASLPHLGYPRASLQGWHSPAISEAVLASLSGYSCSDSGLGSMKQLSAEAQASAQISEALKQARAELNMVSQEVTAMRKDNADLLGDRTEYKGDQAGCDALLKESAAIRDVM